MITLKTSECTGHTHAHTHRHTHQGNNWARISTVLRLTKSNPLHLLIEIITSSTRMGFCRDICHIGPYPGKLKSVNTQLANHQEGEASSH